ncbi:MAG: site-specific integrase [Dehalococcoidales bacterium]|nr:MAG: site-specific integrase [Dehalococcoidales bacterium]
MRTLEVLEKVLIGKQISPKTVRHYKMVLESLAGYSEEWPEKGVVINEWIRSLEGYADMTLWGMWNYVNAAGRYMKKAYGLINPCETAERVTVAKKQRRYFSADEIMRIIGTGCENQVERLLIITLVDSTCRIGELEGLTGRQVGENYIKVKGKTSERRYRLDERICTALKDAAGDDDGYVFKSGGGGNVRIPYRNANALQHWVRRIVKRAGIKGSRIGPHTFRHSGASLVAMETGSALVVKALLQHDDIHTSMSYIHDMGNKIQQRISPLEIVISTSKYTEPVDAEWREPVPVKQLATGKDGEVSIAPVEVSEFVDVEEGEFDDIFKEVIPEIGKGVSIRPLLKEDDLKLIRRAFINYIRSGDAGSDEGCAKSLMRRMLRRV